MRNIYLFSEIDQNLCGQAIQQMYVFAESSLEPITFYVNTNGGDVLHTFALIETMRRCAAPIHTLALGRVFSAGLLVFIAGTKRFAYPNTLMMAHDFSAASGPYSQVRFMGDWIRSKIIEHFQHHTTLTTYTIENKLLGDEFYFDEQEALTMGMVDEIL